MTNRKKQVSQNTENILDSQVVSKERVTNHGEVYTNAREVKAMLDLVKNETERIESKFLEPACGNGNFLIEVLERKLKVINDRYKKSQSEFEYYSIIAISSLYGIDILEDNVLETRERLLNKFLNNYKANYKDKIKKECLEAVKYILNKNIIWGDALTFKDASSLTKPIIFSEWTPATQGFIKRRDYTFEGLIFHSEVESLPLFSDQGEGVYIPNPVREYSLTSYFGVVNES